MRFLLFALIYAAPAIYCVADALQHRDHEPHGLPKLLWVIFFLLFPIVAPGAWIFLGVRDRQSRRQGFRPGGPAPEDDPEFLRWLREKERRKREGR